MSLFLAIHHPSLSHPASGHHPHALAQESFMNKYVVPLWIPVPRPHTCSNSVPHSEGPYFQVELQLWWGARCV